MRLHAGILLALVAAVLVLAFASAYSAYVASTNHRNACARADLILDVMHDILQLAFTPPPATKVSEEEVRRSNAFLTAAYTRIDLARC